MKSGKENTTFATQLPSGIALKSTQISLQERLTFLRVLLTLRKRIARGKYESDVSNFPNMSFAKAQSYCYTRILADKMAEASQPLG